MTVILAIARQIGFAGCAVILLIFAYEGIPGASRIPFLSSVPILGDLATGRVHTYAAQQVRLATDGMISQFESDALASQLAVERNRRETAIAIADAASKRARDAVEAKRKADEKLENAIAQDTGADGCTWSADDAEWMRKH